VRVEVASEIDRSIKALESALCGAQNNPDRLPGLVAIMNRLPALFFEEIRTLTFLQPKVTLVELSAGRFSEKCPIANDTTAVVIRAEKLKGSLLFTADCEAGFAFLEAAFGYDAIQPSKTLKRSLTVTESDVLRVLFRRLARSLTNAFSILVDVKFEVESACPLVEIETICRAAAPVVAVRLMIEYAGRLGYIAIAIPQTLLGTIRPYLSIAPPSESPAPHVNSDPEWTRKLSDEIARAFVSVAAILDEAFVPLETIAGFSVGSTIELSVDSISMARLEFDGVPRYWCELGKSGGDLMLRIKSEYDNEEVSIDE
jgi:flagellar motor switch protein FliM